MVRRGVCLSIYPPQWCEDSLPASPAELKGSGLKPLVHLIVPVVESRTIPPLVLLLLLFLLIYNNATDFQSVIGFLYIHYVVQLSLHSPLAFTAPGFRGPFVY